MSLLSAFSKNPLAKLQKLPRFQHGTFRTPQYLIDYNDPLSFYHEYNDIFNKRIYHFSTSNPTPTIIDAGGYIGLVTLYLKSTYPQAQITTFEPDPTIFSMLQQNIKQNKLTDVTLIQAGVGKTEKTVQFYPDNSDGGSLYTTQETTKPITIELVKLSSYIDEPIDLLKMNIEGAEGEVFEEIAHKLHLIKEIIFEYHAFSSLPQTLGKILDLLNSKGFRYIVTDSVGAKVPVPFNPPKQHQYFNLVYAKNMNL